MAAQQKAFSHHSGLNIAVFCGKYFQKDEPSPPFPSKTEAKDAKNAHSHRPRPSLRLHITMASLDEIISCDLFFTKWYSYDDCCVVSPPISLLLFCLVYVRIINISSFAPLSSSPLSLCRCVETRSDFINICIWYQDIVLILSFHLARLFS